MYHEYTFVSGSTENITIIVFGTREKKACVNEKKPISELKKIFYTYMKCNASKIINHAKNLEKYEHFGCKTNTNIKFTIYQSDRTEYIRNV